MSDRPTLRPTGSRRRNKRRRPSARVPSGDASKEAAGSQAGRQAGRGRSLPPGQVGAPGSARSLRLTPPAARFPSAGRPRRRHVAAEGLLRVISAHLLGARAGQEQPRGGVLSVSRHLPRASAIGRGNPRRRLQRGGFPFLVPARRCLPRCGEDTVDPFLCSICFSPPSQSSSSASLGCLRFITDGISGKLSTRDTRAGRGACAFQWSQL